MSNDSAWGLLFEGLSVGFAIGFFFCRVLIWYYGWSPPLK